MARTLAEQSLAIGGETSGHIIFSHFANTGDGILSALQFLQFAKKSGLPMSTFAGGWSKYPCQLRAIQVQSKPDLNSLPGFVEGIKNLEKELQGKGRILVRYSGTEPKLRILVEGADEQAVKQAAEQAEILYRSKTEETK